MSNEERLILNNYLEDLYQAMQIGDIVFEAKHSSELYNLINKLLKENQKYKEVINKALKLNEKIINMRYQGFSYEQYKPYLLRQQNILKEVEHEKSNN